MPATLADIRIKVRRLTRSPSVTQITTAQIDDYINDFILYDFPENLRTFTLNREYTFITEPFIGTYSSSEVAGEELFDFKNVVISVQPPFYISGVKAFFTQSINEFYSIYPLTRSIVQESQGDGATVVFNGTLTNIPVARDEVLFSSVDINNEGLYLSDDGAGVLTGTGVGVIDYITGVYNLNFNTAPAASQAINSQTMPYVASRPTSVLYYGNQFFLRPIPDQPYEVSFQARHRPTQLLNANAEPELEQWWQYIAYGAAKKVFEDRSDIEGLAKIMPEFDKQERLVLRRTIVQQTNERTATIYSQVNTANFYSWWPNNNNN